MQSLKKKIKKMRIKHSKKGESVYLIILTCFSNTKVIFVCVSERVRPKQKLLKIHILFCRTSTFKEARHTLSIYMGIISGLKMLKAFILWH